MNTLQAVCILDFFQKGIWGGRVEWPKQEWSQGRRARKLWDCDPAEPRSQIDIISNGRAAQKAMPFSFSSFLLILWQKLVVAWSTHTFLYPHVLLSQIFPGKSPSAWSWGSALEQWCTNDLTVWHCSTLEFLYGYKHIVKKKILRECRKAHFWGTVCLTSLPSL